LFLKCDRPCRLRRHSDEMTYTYMKLITTEV
jgi:hypothetical protein